MRILLLFTHFAGAAGFHALPPSLPASAPLALPAAPSVPSAPNLPGVMGLVQYDGDAHFGQYESNMGRLTQLAETAVAQGSRIVVMPEGSAYGYASADELWCRPGMDTFSSKTWTKKCRDVSHIAESMPDGPTTRYWAAFAKERGVYVVYNLPEADGGKFYNTVGVVGPEGFVTKYRKRTLYITDKAYAEAGDQPSLFDSPYGCFGLMICLDASDKSPFFQEYKKLGADAVIVSMDWDDNPKGDYAAAKKFRQWAGVHGLDIYAADGAPWDGAAKYPASGCARERCGLPDVGIGTEGVSVHAFQYP